jgi:hypothetical protein
LVVLSKKMRAVLGMNESDIRPNGGNEAGLRKRLSDKIIVKYWVKCVQKINKLLNRFSVVSRTRPFNIVGFEDGLLVIG